MSERRFAVVDNSLGICLCLLSVCCEGTSFSAVCVHLIDVYESERFETEVPADKGWRNGQTKDPAFLSLDRMNTFGCTQRIMCPAR